MDLDLSTAFWRGNTEWINTDRGRQKLRDQRGLTALGRRLYGGGGAITLNAPARQSGRSADGIFTINAKVTFSDSIHRELHHLFTGLRTRLWGAIV